MCHRSSFRKVSAAQMYRPLSFVHRSDRFQWSRPAMMASNASVSVQAASHSGRSRLGPPPRG